MFSPNSVTSNVRLKGIAVFQPATYCVRDRDAKKTQVTERIFKLTLIHASVIYQIPRICLIHWSPWKFCSIWVQLHSGFSRYGNLTHFCQIIWQIWSYTAQNKFRQKSWSSVSCSANWAREESVGDSWSELSFVLCTIHMLGFIYFWNQ